MRRAALTCALLLAVGAVASGELVMDIVERDNTTWLTGYVTQDIYITTTTDWLSAQLIVTLDEPGKIYQDIHGSINPQAPCWTDGVPPTIYYDTYVSSGVPCDTVSLAGAVDLGGDPTWTFDRNVISIRWYTTNTDDVGQLPVARITLAEDANGAWTFQATAYPAFGPTVRGAGPVVDGHMVPEPAVTMLAFGAVHLIQATRIQRRRPQCAVQH